MEDHRRRIQENVNSTVHSKNSKVLSKEKYDRIVAWKKQEEIKVSSKVKWTIKDKNNSLVSFPELNLTDVLCVPAKKQNENDPTLLGKWRIQAHSENISDILIRMHWTERNHVGYKKLLAKVQSRYQGIPRSIIQETCRTCPVCLLCVRQTNKAEIKPILSSGFLTRAQIDLIDLMANIIILLITCITRQNIILYGLKKKTADEVATGLNKRVFPYLVTFEDHETAVKIMATKSPWEHKKLGRQVKNFKEDLWSMRSVYIVKRGNLLKFTQNRDLKEILLATDPKELVEASPFDRIWGVGLSKNDPRIADKTQWKGQNRLGKILVDVRNIIKTC